MKPRRPRRGGYTDHAVRRVVQRWRAHGDPPLAQDWWCALEAPARWARQYRIETGKGRRCLVTRDALALVAKTTVITVARIGFDAVDDLRATMLCRAMGLDATWSDG